MGCFRPVLEVQPCPWGSSFSIAAFTLARAPNWGRLAARTDALTVRPAARILEGPVPGIQTLAQVRKLKQDIDT
jgi:hypothetical protein